SPTYCYLQLLTLPPSLFLFNDTSTTEIYTLSLHDALPILVGADPLLQPLPCLGPGGAQTGPYADYEDLAAGYRHYVPSNPLMGLDRKSTRLNSSHVSISYAVFCLKKKKKKHKNS